MIHEQAQGKCLTPGTLTLVLLMAAGAVAAVYRYGWGLGDSTNLSDQYPWGLWVGIDVMSGVALAAGGFITAALVHLFGGDKYYALVRPAVLTGFLGYVFVGIGLLVDLALPWHIWHPIIMWPKHSAMFLVAWCEMLYLTVLALEFAPLVFERFRSIGRPLDRWRKFTNVFSVVAIAFFVGIISLSWTWGIVTLILFTVLAVVLASPKMRQNTVGLFVATLLVVFGVVFNRCNVTWLAMHMPGEGTYFPSVAEIVITISIIASLVFFFTLAVKTLPVFARHAEEVSFQMLVFFGRVLSAPFVTEAVRRLKHHHPEPLTASGRCPWCGSPPGLAKLKRQQGKEGKRVLFCSLCGESWQFARLQCTFCGSQQALGILSVEPATPCSIETCDGCRGYLKTVDERKLPEDETVVPLIETTATLYLDLIAEKEGYARGLPYGALQ